MSIQKTFLYLTILSACLASLSQCKESDPEPEISGSIQMTETLTLESDLEVDFITNFEFTSNETLWIGTFNSGLYRMVGTTVDNFNTDNSPLPHDRINDVFIDNHNKVWAATDLGFVKTNGTDWEVYNVKNTPLPTEIVTEIAVNKRGEILISTAGVEEGGLLFGSLDGQWKKFNTDNSDLPCNFILEIEPVNDNSFWVSTGQFQGKGGIVKFENEVITHLLTKDNNGLLYNWIDNLELSGRYLWAGYRVPIYNESGVAEGGIQRIDLLTNQITSYFPQSTGLLSNRIYGMQLRADNSLWFTTGSDDPFCENCYPGIGVLFDNGQFIASSSLNSDIPSNAFFPKLNEDHQGNMYVSNELSLYQLEIVE